MPHRPCRARPATVQALNVRFDQKGHERPFQKAVIVDVVDGYVNAGDRIVIRLGDRRRGPGTRVQTFAEDNFRFRLYVDPLGTSRFVAVPGDISIDIRAGAPSDVLLNGPRFVRPGTRAPFRLSLQDRWGNACRDAGGTARVVAYDARGEATDASTRCPMPLATCAVDDLPVDAGTLRIVADVPARPDVRAAETWLTSDASLPAPVRGTPTCTSTPTIRSAPTARRTTRATHATSAASTCSAIRRTISRSPTRTGNSGWMRSSSSTTRAASSSIRCRNGAAARPRAATTMSYSRRRAAGFPVQRARRAQPHAGLERGHEGQCDRLGRWPVEELGCVCGRCRASSGDAARGWPPLYPRLAPSRAERLVEIASSWGTSAGFTRT